MNNKKHLSEVKRLIHIYETCNDSSLAKDYADHLMRHHARYFVEQAERVEELENEYEVRRVEYLEEHIDRLERQAKKAIGTSRRNGKEIMKLTDANSLLVEQNKRYREALEKVELILLMRGEGQACDDALEVIYEETKGE